MHVSDTLEEPRSHAQHRPKSGTKYPGSVSIQRAEALDKAAPSETVTTFLASAAQESSDKWTKRQAQEKRFGLSDPVV